MVLNTVIAGGDELVRVVVGDLVDARPTTDRSLWRTLTAQKHLNMHHVVLLDMLRVIVLGTVEYQISWFHLLKLKFYRQGIVLVSLVAWTQLESELVSQIPYSSSD